MVREKVTHYLKALPKAWRNRLVPLPDSVTAFLEAVPSGRAPLPEAIRGWLGERLRDDAAAVGAGTTRRCRRISPVNLRVVDAAGRELGSDRDPAALRAKLGEAAQMTFAAGRPGARAEGDARLGVRRPAADADAGRRAASGSPATRRWSTTSTACRWRCWTRAAAAERSTRAGVIRLIRFALKDAFARFEKGGPGFRAGGAAAQARRSPPTRCWPTCSRRSPTAPSSATTRCRAPPAAFAEQVKRARTRLPAVGEGAFRLLATIAAAHYALSQRIAGAAAVAVAARRRGARAARRAGPSRASSARRRGRSSTTCRAIWPQRSGGWSSTRRTRAATPGTRRRWPTGGAGWPSAARPTAPPVASSRGSRSFRWLLEELTVSLFAQELRTPQPVSYKRLERAWAELAR